MDNHKYREAITQIQEMADAYPNLTRKDRHRIIEYLTGIPKGQQEVVERYSRALRHVLPKDQRSAELEAAWHKPQSMIIQEEDWNRTFRNTTS